MAASPTVGMLRPALELAWAVARAGNEIRPGVAAPGRLRPLLRFAKLPDRALTTVRQVVDDDQEFRERVAKLADETELGRAGWLWLVRPDGWDEELATMAAEAGVLAAEHQEEKDERRATRRLRAAEAATAKATAEAARLRQINADLLAEVAAERQARRGAEDRRDDLEAARAAAEAERSRLAPTIAELESRIVGLTSAAGETDRQLADRDHGLDAARAEIDRLQSELTHSGQAVARLAADHERLRAAMAEGVRRAAAAARELDAALRETAGALGPVEALGPRMPILAVEPAEPDGSEIPVANPRAAAGRSVASEVGAAPGVGRTPNPPSAPGAGMTFDRARRRPAPLPPAVFDDSNEAAHHLVRVTGMLLIVDGYNVTLSSWPGVELSSQRHRLVDALAELVMRAGTAVHVVFDGAEGTNRFGAPAVARRKLRVTFSPSGVEADEVIIDMVETADVSQPIVVATDDRRVRHEVGRRGARVISVAQLLAVLGRIPDTPSAAV